VSASNSNFAEAQTMLAEMAAGMKHLALAANASISDVAASWLTVLHSPFSILSFQLSDHIKPYKGQSA